MSIIIKPTPMIKGTSYNFTLNKEALVLHPSVSSDTYYSDPQNWNRVLLNYESSEGRQYEVVAFNASESSPSGTFYVSPKARDLFQIKSLHIVDFDGELFTLTRDSLEVLDFDVSFNSGSTPAAIFPNKIAPSAIYLGDGAGSGDNYFVLWSTIWNANDASLSPEQYAQIQVGDTVKFYAYISENNAWGPTGLELTITALEIIEPWGSWAPSYKFTLSGTFPSDYRSMGAQLNFFR